MTLWAAYRRFTFQLVVGCICVSLCGKAVQAQLRVVTYNTRGGPRSDHRIVLKAIGEEGGLSNPIDVLAVQEQGTTGGTTLGFVGLLNDLYGAGVYDHAPVIGDANGDVIQALIYNTTTIELLGMPKAFGSLEEGAQERQTLRYHLRPIGHGASAEFYVYNNHYKASEGSENERRRLVEATALRADLDALGDGTHAILAGDFNVYDADELMFVTLLATGPGQAFDPINANGEWHDNAAFKAVHTQNPSPASNGGRMDDRFDFQLVTGELLDGVGLEIIPESYRAFGNNGTHLLNGPITTGTGASPEVLAALANASDHLPVVADYRLPPVLHGDFDGNGLVEQSDLVLVHWGAPSTPGGWLHDPPAGAIDQNELDQVLLNWGNTTPLNVAPVPEPSSGGLILTILNSSWALRRRARHSVWPRPM